MTTASYQIKGMTCGHCVQAVGAALGTVVGVTDVAVDLDTGRASVTSDRPLDEATVRAAVEQAGYEVVG